MSVKIFADFTFKNPRSRWKFSSTLRFTTQKCRWKFPSTLRFTTQNVAGNFCRHYPISQLKMSLEISIDITLFQN